MKVVLTATVPIDLCGLSINTEMMVFPNDDNKTLLVLRVGYSSETWYFSNDPNAKFSFVQSYVLNSPEILQADVARVTLRNDEGTKLTSSGQRGTYA